MIVVHKGVHDLHLIPNIIKINSKMVLLIMLQIYHQILLKELANKGYMTLVIFNLYHIVLFYLEFSYEVSILIFVWMRVKHVVAEQHVSSMVHKLRVWDIFVFIFLHHWSHENSNPYTTIHSSHSKTHSFSCIWRNGVISECKSLIGKRWPGLSGVSSCNMNAISFKLWTIDHKELKLENSIDIFIKLINSFNVAFFIMGFITFTINWIRAKKGTVSAILIETDLRNLFLIAASDPFKRILHSSFDHSQW